MSENLIRLTLTPAEGLMIGVMIDAAIEQFEAASIEERNDPDMIVAYDIWKRLRPYLPRPA